ncbi:MAG: hypothetical protein ACLFR2_07455 [Candidatus Kapaibacterium sp.]
MIFDGSEPVIVYGMDTTKNWWIITKPFSGKFRLNVNGFETEVYDSVYFPVFSPDSYRWAAFAKLAGQWEIITNDSILKLNATDPGEIVFSPDSRILAYTYFSGNIENVVCGDHKYEVFNRVPGLYVGHGGYRVAFMGMRGEDYILNINGKETTLYDNILPLGFWKDGKMMYAAQNGITWQLYKGDEPVSQTYSRITEARINLNGTVAAFIGELSSGNKEVVIISDEYYEPLTGRAYDDAWNLVLHPYLALAGYNAYWQTYGYTVLNNTEYDCGVNCGAPEFTWNGEDMYFAGCGNFDCFINVTGRKYNIASDISLTSYYAKKPGHPTVAYATGSSMIVRFLDTGELHAGMMVDQIIAPRYNRFDKRYETIGRISERLYLMTCAP